MGETLCTLALLLGIYLYLDKFLFEGRLGTLFLEGWRGLLSAGCRKVRDSGFRSDTSSVSVTHSENLVENKAYVYGPTVSESDKRAETESKTAETDTFALPKREIGKEEVTEWRDASFGQRPQRKSAPMRWEDPAFSGRFIQRDDESGLEDIVPVIDPEQVKREVEASLQIVLEEQARDEFIPTDEERSGLEHFDMNAYR